MSISVECPECEKKLKVPVTAAGKKVRCPACKNAVPVPEVKQVVAVEDEEETYGTRDDDDDRPRRGKQKRRRDEDDDDDRPRKRKRRRDDDDSDDDDRGRRRKGKPHRGVKILLFGMLSILLSCIPIVAWYLGATAIVMANEDSPKMRSGSMDRSGQGMTMAGNICAYIGCVLALIFLILGIIAKVMKYF